MHFTALRVLALVCFACAFTGTAQAATRTQTYSYRTRNALDVYRDSSWKTPRPAVIFVHGGGWVSGSRTKFSHRPFAAVASELIAEGFVAVSVGYRLAPDHQFAAGRNDVAAAVAYVRGHARSLGVNPQRLALFGTSAGANLALNVGMRGSRVRAIVGYSAPTALAQLYRTSPTMRSRIISYLGCKPVRCPSRARAAGTLGAVDSTDPPVLLASSADDSIVPYSQQVLMADRLRAANVPTTLIKVAGSYHGGKLKRFVWPRTLDFLHARLD